uniref:SKP1 component POZ domain-containing protein n=1 Tax=Capra hircus TaxID=9925 RepID=A0A8C2RU51_CAPHI
IPSIKLQSSDGEIIEVDIEIAKQSVTLKTVLEDLGMRLIFAFLILSALKAQLLLSLWFGRRYNN